MEGIVDGHAVDGCFVCELLFPDRYTEDCPRCGKRMHYHPAVMAEHADAKIRSAIKVLTEGPGSQELVATCLEALHRHLPDSWTALDEAGISQSDLRALWQKPPAARQ